MNASPMATPPEHEGGQRFVHPEAGADKERRADELFVHGLLGTLHDSESGKRIEAAIAALDRAISGTGAVAGRAPGRRLGRVRRLLTAGAVLVLAVAGVVIFAVPGSGSAYATVSASIQAAKGPGAHRYEVRLATWPQTELPATPTGTVDNSEGRTLLRMTAPDGHTIVAGRDGAGEWALRRDGSVERENPRGIWPRWSTVSDESIFAESVDGLLGALPADYELRSRGKQALPGGGEARYEHIIGVLKRDRPRRGAERVDLWIDVETKLLERLEMSWPPPPAGMVQGPGPGPGPEGRGGVERPEGPRPRGPRPERAGDGPLDRPPPPRDGERPPPRDGGPMDRPMRDGPRPEGPGARVRPPPLSRVVVTRADVPAFEAGWFGPEAHR